MNKLDIVHLPKYISYNLISNLFIAILIFIALPIYSKIMNINDFGIFCFIYVLLTILKIFDLGFSATSTRYISQIYKSAFWQMKSKNLIKICEVLLFLFSFFILIFFFIFRNYIVNSWINFDLLSLLNIDNSNLKLYELVLLLIPIILFFKLLSTLYRGVLYAIGEQPLFNIVRLFSEFLLLFSCFINYYFLKSILIFYLNFLLIIIFEIIIYKLIINKKLNFSQSTSFLKGVKILYINKFYILNIAFSSMIWLIVSNLDKVFFANIISIDLFGVYTIVTTLAIFPLLLFTPIFEAAFPNLNNLYHNNQSKTFELILNFLLSICLICFFIFLLTYELFGDVFWYYLFKDISKLILANKIFLNFILGYFILSFCYILFTLLKVIGILRIHTILSVFWAIGILISFYFSIVLNGNPEQYSQYWLLVNFIFSILFVLLNLLYFRRFNIIFHLIKKNIISIILFIIFISIIKYFNFENFYIFYKDLIMLLLCILTLLFIFIITNGDVLKFIYNFPKKSNKII